MAPRTKHCLIVTVNGVKVKRCSGCDIEKQLSEYNQGTGPGGLHRHCKGCCKAFREKRKLQAMPA